METMERMEVSENPTENSMASGASWLEAAAAEAESTDREEQDPSAMAAMAAIYAAEKRWQETAETVEQHHSDLSKLIESKCQEVCQCVNSSNDALFGRLEVLFQEQAERQSQLQSKFDSIGEDETALCMARMARDIVQVPLIEPSPKPPSCRPALLSVPGAVMSEDAICDSRAMSSVKSGGTDFSIDSSKDKHPSSVIQREDEEAYQAALVKAKRLQHQETKRLTRFISSGQDEHWRHKLREFMQTALMESICAGVIFTNSILIGIQTDYMARRIGEEAPLVFTVIDAGYTAIFGLELAVRLLASGVGFFYRDRGLFWNYLDVVIVLPSIFELVLAVFVQLPAVSTDITVVRILRITRVFRVIRVVKVMKFIRSLRQLVESVMHTMRSLAWSMLLLVVIIYVFAIMFTDASASYQEENREETSLTLELFSHFSDLHVSMHTLFRSVSGGIDWGIVAHVLGEVHWIWMYLFSLYVGFVMFAVLNVMTGIFCQVAVESSWNDPQLLLQHSIVERERQRDLIRQLYHHFGQNLGRRKITLVDIEEQFDSDGVQGLFSVLDIYPGTAWDLFKQLDINGDACISEEEFVSGILRLKGVAKSWDMEIIAQEQRGLRKLIDAYLVQTATPGTLGR